MEEGPRIGLLDIETFPDTVYSWSVYDSNAIEVKEHWYIISYSWKWLGGEHITKGFWQYRDGEKGLVRQLWKLLDKAEIVVAHNGIRFDIKKINARLIVHGLKPPSPYAVVDTRAQAKRVAGFSSNKLDWLCSQLHIGRKVEHQGFGLWKGCANGDKRARKKMLSYNRHDVVLLEKLYKLLSPWMKQPNAGMWSGKTICSNPACKSRDLSSDGYRRNSTMMYKRIICNKCGQRMRVPKAESREKPLVNI